MIPKPRKKHVSEIACVAVAVSKDMTMHILENAYRFQSFDLGASMVVPSGKSTIYKAKRALKLSGAL